jgi:hypothetical protein
MGPPVRAVARLAAVAAVSIAAASASGAKVYSLQVGAFPTEAEAGQLAGVLAPNASPVTVRHDPANPSHPYKVWAGVYPAYVEAWVAKSALPPDFAPGCFVVSGEVADPDFDTCSLPRQLPFNTAGLDQPDGLGAHEYYAAVGLGSEASQAAPPDSVAIEAMPGDDLFATALQAPKKAARGVLAGERYLKLYPVSPKSNRVRLHLARSLGRGANLARAIALVDEVKANGSPAEKLMAEFLRGHVQNSGGQKAASLETFKDLAANTNLPPGLRRECMQRAASILHSLQRYPEAWLAFSQIAETADAPAAEAQARVELAGLAFELVTRGKCSWDDVRSYCQQALATPDIPMRQKATADLMHLETYYEEGNLDQALADAQSFTNRYSEVYREYYTARLWEGIILHRKGRDTEAKFVLEAVQASTPPDGERFANVEPRAMATLWLASIAGKQGKAAERDNWLSVLEKQHPASSEASYARQQLGRNKSQ